MGRYFGTDGIRGLAGRSPLTASDVERFGRAAAEILHRHASGPLRVLIVRDTRASGSWLLNSLAKGLERQGVDVYDAGVLPTPAVAHLAKAHRFNSGVVISASHNPPAFNGIKFFTSQGTKWPDTWEADVERIFDDRSFSFRRRSAGRRISADVLANDYKEFLISTLSRGANFKGLRLAIDCANGATVKTAPDVFQTLGARILALSIRPNGRNINVNCGSQHTRSLAKLVRSEKCHAGVAFDGDGDRVILVDEKGREVNGDHVIGLLACQFLRLNRLPKRTVVLTVMANLGLKKFLKKSGIRSFETAVGDRHVSEAMRLHGVVLGGEQSGHIILGDYLPSGDGLLTALHVLTAMRERKKPLSALAGDVPQFPQVLHNIATRQKPPLKSLRSVQDAIRRAEKELGPNGRVLVRYSGTEPLLRIMLEGPTENQLRRLAQTIALAAKAAIG